MTEREGPPQDYYPSAKVRLILRFEEFGVPTPETTGPTKTIPKLTGVKDERAEMTPRIDPTAPPGVTRWLIGTGGGEGGAPGVSSRSSDMLTQEIVGVIPYDAEWKQNGLRTADTLSLTIRFADLPIDPRTIRACAVKYYLGCVTAEEYARGVAGGSRRGRTEGGTDYSEPLHLVSDTFRDAYGRDRSNLRFQGWVDVMKSRWASEEEAMHTLECVDNTRLLEKTPRPAKLVVGMDTAIDEAVAVYLSNFPQCEGLTVEYLPSDTPRDEIPRLKGVLAGSAHVPRLGPPPTAGGGTGGSTPSVLDYLTEIVTAIGHSVRVDGTRLVIQRSSMLLGQGAGLRPDDPYRGRNLPSGRYPVRAMIYGRNIEEMEVARSFAGRAATNVEVRSYDPQRKQVIVARYPEKGDEVTTVLPGDGKADKAWRVIPLADGIRDRATLKRIAEEYFHTAGRQEMTVTLSTRNLASFGGGNADPDLLDMTVGDTFSILSSAAVDEGTYAQVEEQQRSRALNIQRLVSAGFSREFAAAYATAYGDAGFPREYRLRAMAVSWSADDGVTFSIEGANYVTARIDPPPVEEIPG